MKLLYVTLVLDLILKIYFREAAIIYQLMKSEPFFHGPMPVISDPVENVVVSSVHISEIITEIHPCPFIAPVIEISVSLHTMLSLVKYFHYAILIEALVYQEQRQHTPWLHDYVANQNTLVTPDIKATAKQLN